MCQKIAPEQLPISSSKTENCAKRLLTLVQPTIFIKTIKKYSSKDLRSSALTTMKGAHKDQGVVTKAPHGSGASSHSNSSSHSERSVSDQSDEETGPSQEEIW